MTALRMLPAGQGNACHQGEILGCSYSDDGAFVLTCGWDGQIRCWDTQSGAALSAISTGGQAVSACAVSPCRRFWLGGTLDGLLRLWDPVSHCRVGELLPHTRPITAIAVSPRGDNLASSSFDCTVVLYRKPDELARHRVLKGHQDTVVGCVFSPDGRTLISWSTDATLRLWDVPSGAALATLACGDKFTTAAASGNGLWVVAGTGSGAIQLWNLTQMELSCSQQLRDPLVGSCFLADDATIVTVDGAGRLAMFSLPALEQLLEQPTPYAVRTCAFSPLGDKLALGGTSGRPHIVAIDGGRADRDLKVRPTLKERSMLSRLLGRGSQYSCTCPHCSCSFSVRSKSLQDTVSCPECGKALSIAASSS